MGYEHRIVLKMRRIPVMDLRWPNSNVAVSPIRGTPVQAIKYYHPYCRDLQKRYSHVACQRTAWNAAAHAPAFESPQWKNASQTVLNMRVIQAMQATL